MLKIHKMGCNNEKQFNTKLKNLIQIFYSKKISSKILVKNFSLNSILLKRFNFNSTIKNQMIFISFFIEKFVFQQSPFLFLNFPPFFKNRLMPNQILTLSIKPYFCQKLNFCFLLLNLQKQIILGVYVEFLFFHFFEYSTLKNFKNLVNFIQPIKKFKTRNVDKNIREIPPVKLNRNANFQTKHQYNFSTLAMISLNSFLNNFLMTYTGQYWYQNEIIAKKKNFLNFDLHSKTILKNMQKKQKKTVKRIILKIETQIHHFEHSLLNLNDFYLFEFLKKIFKLSYHSTNQNLVELKKLFYENRNLKKKIFFILYPTINTFPLENNWNSNDKTETNESTSFLLKKQNTFLKNDRKKFYFLKQIFSQFYDFELTQLFYFYKMPIFFNNYCFELVNNKVCQPFNSMSLEFKSFFKKDNIDFQSLNILNVLGQFKPSPANLLERTLFNTNKHDCLINFNKELLQSINLKGNDTNFFISFKLLRLIKMSFEKKKSPAKKQESISNQKSVKFLLFVMRNNITEQLKVIQKIIFNLIKKTNLVFFMNLDVPKGLLNILKSKQDQILLIKNYTLLCYSRITLINKETEFFGFFRIHQVFEQLKKCVFLLKNWFSETLYFIPYMKFEFYSYCSMDKNILNILTKTETELGKLYKTSSGINYSHFNFETNHNLSLLSNISRFPKTPVDLTIFKHLSRLKDCIKFSSTKTQNLLIQILTPKIFAYCYYYRFVSHQRVFFEINKKLMGFLWRWACRRHNNKSKRWIKAKYFYQINEKHWIFGTPISNSFFQLSLQKKFGKENLSSKNPSLKISSVLFVYLPFHSQIYHKLKTVAYMSYF